MINKVTQYRSIRDFGVFTMRTNRMSSHLAKVFLFVDLITSPGRVVLLPGKTDTWPEKSKTVAIYQFPIQLFALI